MSPRIEFVSRITRLPFSLTLCNTCLPSPCERLSRSPSTMETPLPWVLRPLGNPEFRSSQPFSERRACLSSNPFIAGHSPQGAFVIHFPDALFAQSYTLCALRCHRFQIGYGGCEYPSCRT